IRAGDQSQPAQHDSRGIWTPAMRLPPAMVPVPDGAAWEEIARAPTSVSVSVWPIIVDLGRVDARGVRVARCLHIHAPLRVYGRGLIIVTLDDPLALHHARWRWALDDGVPLRVVRAKISADGGRAEAEEGKGD